ncbi:MAG: hypothetical protein ACPHN1_05520, partial [Candidatus Puniceispirillaceae bacterium]
MTNDKQQTPNSRLAGCDAQVAQAIAALITCYEREGKLLVCGNGGSAADAEPGRVHAKAGDRLDDPVGLLP